MAEEVVKAKKAKKVRELASLDIERLFMLSKPERVRGRDGKLYDVFHRYGASGGAYTKKDLMHKLGYSAELAEVERDAQKRYKSISEVRSVVEGRETKLKSTLNSRVAACKHKMTKDYERLNGLIPLIASVRIHSESEERRLFIQGFVNKSGEFVIGGRDDAALWAIEVMMGARGLAEKFKLATSVGRDLISKGALTGPVKERLALTLKA